MARIASQSLEAARCFFNPANLLEAHRFEELRTSPDPVAIPSFLKRQSNRREQLQDLVVPLHVVPKSQSFV